MAFEFRYTKGLPVGDHLSDHRAVAIQVRPRATPRDNGPKRLHRVRLNFSSDAALREEFCEAASALAQRAPQHSAQLVEWWKGFKEGIFQLCARLNKRQRMQHQHAYAGETANLEAAYLRAEAGTDGAVAEVLAAQTTLSAAVAAERAAASMSSRREWLHDNERPSPSLTTRLRPAAAPGIAVLRSATGGLVSSARECAEVMAIHWVAVSRAPATDLDAQNTVMAALSEAPRVLEAEAAHLSCVEVTRAAVAAAMKRAKPSTSPGPDGLPLEVYRRFKPIFLPSSPAFSRSSLGMCSSHLGFKMGCSSSSPSQGRLTPPTLRIPPNHIVCCSRVHHACARAEEVISGCRALPSEPGFR